MSLNNEQAQLVPQPVDQANMTPEQKRKDARESLKSNFTINQVQMDSQA